MIDLTLPAWAGWAMGCGLLLFILMVALSVRRNHGIKRSLFAMPYTLWMFIFTLLPCVLIAYYALLLVMIMGPANKNNVNDNTSGVAAVLRLMESLPQEARERAAFVLFDDE